MLKTLRSILWVSIAIVIMAICLTVTCGFTMHLQDPYQLKYTILNSAGAFVSGQFPTLHILKAATSQYYNFHTLAWDAAPSVFTEHTLAELNGAYYHYTFTSPDTTPASYTFLVKNHDATYADIQNETGHFTDINLVNVKGAGYANGTHDLKSLFDALAAAASDIKGAGWTNQTLVSLAAQATLLYSNQAQMQGSGFWSATDSLEAIRNRGDVAWVSASTTDFFGTGDTAVDEDYGGNDVLAYKTGAGVGIDNATITAYLKTDYDARNWGVAYMKGVSKTDVSGYWVKDLQLDCGYTYTIVFYKQGYYGPDTQEVTVTCP